MVFSQSGSAQATDKPVTEQINQHELVQIKSNPELNFTAIFAIHNTCLGPAAGGVRRWVYTSREAAELDARRLSEGMTWKNALAGIPFGGGKSVIMNLDGRDKPTAEQLDQYAQWLNELNGRYVTAEDVGMGVAQLQQVARKSPHVSGLGLGAIGGDPSPYTAWGVFLGLKSAVQTHLGVGLRGLRVAVQGLGAVGMALCKLLHEAGAQLVVADLSQDRTDRAAAEFGAVVVASDVIHSQSVDVFAPCALGGVLNAASIPTIQARVIAGAANNQLANADSAVQLAARGILYAPDFVINAGGVVSVAQEHLLQTGYFNGADSEGIARWRDHRINGIAHRLEQVIDWAAQHGSDMDSAARALAITRLQASG